MVKNGRYTKFLEKNSWVLMFMILSFRFFLLEFSAKCPIDKPGLTKAIIHIPVDSRGNRHFDSDSNLGGNGAPRLWAFKIMSYYQVLHIGCHARGLLYHKHNLLVWVWVVLSGNVDKHLIQCPLDIQTLDKEAALPIATATRVTDLRQYINSNLAYSNLKFLVLCTN